MLDTNTGTGWLPSSCYPLSLHTPLMVVGRRMGGLNSIGGPKPKLEGLEGADLPSSIPRDELPGVRRAWTWSC
jgi:hypothetical protein